MPALPARIGFTEHLAIRAEQIYEKILSHGQQQVRLCGRHVLTFKFPAPRGYGVRGTLVGVYGAQADPDWIRDDLISLAKGQNNAAQKSR